MTKQKEAEDPRYAYLKHCKEQNIVPKMGLIIGETESNVLDFEGKGLTSKTVHAVADAISKYKFKIEHVNFDGNLLKDVDCKLIFDSLQNHYKNIITLSFKGNKLGSAGVTTLLEAYDKAKALESLDLSENIISDEVAMRLFEKIEKTGFKLKYLALGRNFIGKTVHAQGMATAFATLLLSSNCNLEVLDMSWNNIGGRIGKIMLQALGSCHTLKSVKFAYNLLGVSTNIKGKMEEPAILELCEVLLKSQALEEIDVSYNSIDSFAIYCLSYGLERSMSLKTIHLSGNPIGSVGVRYLINSVHESANKQFNNFIVDTSLAASATGATGGYEITFAEGDYAFDLSRAFDRLKLRKLLDLATAIAKEVPGTTVEQCLTRIKLDGGKPWPLPRNEAAWSWSWPIDPLKGTLRITLSLKHLKSALPEAKPSDILEKVKKAGGSEKKSVHEHDFENICKLLMEYRNNDKEESQVEMLIALAQDNKFWSYQVKEALLSLKSAPSMETALPYLMVSTMDRLLLHTLFDTLPKISVEGIFSKSSVLTEYTPLNPNGHYVLDLSKPYEFMIAAELVAANNRAIKVIEKNKLFDRSKNGNKSCFRNETLQHTPITIGYEWKAPKTGMLEFDFVYLYQSRDQIPLNPEPFNALYERLKSSQVSLSEKIQAFKVMSEYIWITSEQLKQLLELHEDAAYKRDMYMYGIGRVTDHENYDFIKTAIKPTEEKAMKDLYRMVGILNLFNPFHPDGTYEFNLKVYEERIMMSILCELGKKEGVKCITKVVQDQKPVEDIEQFVKAPPKEGVVEMTYVCPAESVKTDARKMIGEKFLSWGAKIDFLLLSPKK